MFIGLTKIKMEKFTKLLQLAEMLRGENGCPWDKKQTVKSMMKYLQNEVDEIKEAVEKEDFENLAEEIGDVFFQIIMINQIAKEAGHFDMDKILSTIEHKIISRHTWVFGDDKVETAEEARELWKKNKQKQ
jgi:tetrapyrrole methylase family protein/MazG family protein